MAELTLRFTGEATSFNWQRIKITDTEGVVVYRANNWKRYVPVSNQGLYVPGWNSDEEHYLPVNDDYIAEWYVRPWLLYPWDPSTDRYKINERQENLFTKIIRAAQYNNYTSSTSWVVTPFIYGQPIGRNGYVVDTYPIKEVNSAEAMYELSQLGNNYDKSFYRKTFQDVNFNVLMVMGNRGSLSIHPALNLSNWIVNSISYDFTYTAIGGNDFKAYTLQPPNTSFLVSRYDSSNIRNNGLLEIFMTVSDKRVIESANK